MPIVVSHRPPAGVIAGAAYEGGLGDWARFQQQMQMQAAELAQRDFAQQRALAAQAQQNAMARQDDMMDRQFRMGLDGWEANRQDAQRLQARQWDVADADAAFARQKELAGLAAADVGRRMAADDFRGFMADAGARIAGLREAGMVIDPKKYAEAVTTIRGAMGDSSLSPAEVNDAVLNAMGTINGLINSATPTLDGPPVKLPEAYEKETMWQVGPDGINRQYQRIMRNGVEQWDVMAEQDPAAKPEVEPLNKFLEAHAFDTIKDAEGNERFITDEELARRAQTVAKAKEMVLGGKIPLPPPNRFAPLPAGTYDKPGALPPQRVNPPPPDLQNPSPPPPPPPPVIADGPEGQEKLKQMLAENPQGVVFIDARDGKKKFLAPPR